MFTAGAKTLVGSGNLKHISGLDMHCTEELGKPFLLKGNFIYSKVKNRSIIQELNRYWVKLIIKLDLLINYVFQYQ